MATFFSVVATLLFLGAFPFLVLGLIKPSWFEKVLKKNSRLRVIGGFFALLFASFVWMGIAVAIDPSLDDAEVDAEAAVEIEEDVEEGIVEVGDEESAADEVVENNSASEPVVADSSQPEPVTTYTQPEPEPEPEPEVIVTPDPEPVPTTICCKTCGANSQACGDSCISNSYTCSKPPGCACEG